MEFELKKNKNYLDDINSKYIVASIFKILIRTKALTIIKYSKKIQNRMELNIENYKVYSQKLSPIEIEITPYENQYCKIIHYLNEEEKKYYHIYLNNNKEEIKRKYINKDKEIRKIKIIKIIIDHQIKSFEGLFFECRYIESINFKKFYRNNINNMSRMFFRCSSLKELNLDNFVTDNVTDMSYMFSECRSLKKLNLSYFTTFNVTDMRYMFSECKSLEELNLRTFITFKVSNMNHIFMDVVH